MNRCSDRIRVSVPFNMRRHTSVTRWLGASWIPAFSGMTAVGIRENFEELGA